MVPSGVRNTRLSKRALDLVSHHVHLLANMRTGCIALVDRRCISLLVAILGSGSSSRAFRLRLLQLGRDDEYSGGLDARSGDGGREADEADEDRQGEEERFGELHLGEFGLRVGESEGLV
jgi:hypothetical protein